MYIMPIFTAVWVTAYLFGGAWLVLNCYVRYIPNKIRCICMLDTRLSLTDLYRKYKIMSIDNVIDLELCKLGFKLNNDMLPVNLLASLKGDARGKPLKKEHNYNTRNKRELNLPMTDNSKYHSSFLVQAIKCYSKITTSIKGLYYLWNLC